MAPGVVEAAATNAPPSSDSGILSVNDAKQQHWTPQTVLSTLPVQPQTGSSSPVPFFHLLERLKTTKREGWRRFGISHGESISDHMYRMSILTMFAPPALAARINVQRCTMMALIHDMAELLVGDITPVDGVLKPEKSRRETETMDYLCSDVLGRVAAAYPGHEIKKIWQEYEDSETLESKYVHDIDKVELLLQMMEYERQNEGNVDLGEFAWVSQKIILPEVKAWCDDILKERQEFWASLGKSPSGSSFTAKQEEQHREYYGDNTTGASKTS